jgi:hypothetical protein
MRGARRPQPVEAQWADGVKKVGEDPKAGDGLR